MTEFFFNGVPVSKKRLNALMDQAQEWIVSEENSITEEFGVSSETAGAIVYLRSRSRWTSEKERELIERDLAGNPIDTMEVFSGEF